MCWKGRSCSLRGIWIQNKKSQRKPLWCEVLLLTDAVTEKRDLMDDKKIIDLYWARDEAAIRETALKYGRLCACIAGNVLASREDCEECVNDTYFGVWNAIPDKRPDKFMAFIGKIARNLALKKYEYVSAAKRNPSAVSSLEELGDCVSGGESVEAEIEEKWIESVISDFLWQQDEGKRNVFIRRYWYFESIEGICERTGFSQSKVKSMLFEMRRRLKCRLEREGIQV